MHTLQISLYTLVFLIVLALLFGFMNGFNDAANAIATVVSTGVLKPQQAVAMAAMFNFVAILVFQLQVASTVGKDIIDPAVVDHYVVFGALVGAIAWSLVTSYQGIPSSSSHALIGGLIGAAVAKDGIGSLIGSGLVNFIAFVVLSPLLGLLVGSLMMLLVSWVCVRSTPRRADKWFRRLQLGSAAMYSLGHGGNDAQKTMGIIWMLLITSGYSGSNETLPAWAVISCYCAISFGTLFGGWRIVKTMGQRITKLKPVGGFCAESGGAIMLFVTTAMGIPISTTHTITGAIVGVGSVKKMSAVRWGVAGNIVWTWVLTIPASAFMAAMAWWIGTRLL
ncbi:inorganic phosphate transporter [Actimicrobium sp. CCC2.4]|uniref:inorganic phosphate transporter n=1 Tax=Actimicrobium sp. CCC2.4 TaxID=3048606 RepID=UPI002AC94CBA|nr:inorganic phosphate transporter [Actimicrobium sp. CCC2.4]MEB0134734.1 inorganic phosphate transporter [Actimicrobium sp. CCC2.4]WPX30673.1 anion permease [Actimicrobium sp. CCC2.4]